MANEARISISLNITKRADDGTILLYEQLRASYSADVDGTKGPAPGALTIPTGGKVIDLTELLQASGTPGFCWIENQDENNYVEYGAYDPNIGQAYLPFEIGPGERQLVKLSRNIREIYTDTGTGTSGPSYYLFMKANTADVNVAIKGFQR